MLTNSRSQLKHRHPQLLGPCDPHASDGVLPPKIWCFPSFSCFERPHGDGLWSSSDGLQKRAKRKHSMGGQQVVGFFSWGKNAWKPWKFKKFSEDRRSLGETLQECNYCRSQGSHYTLGYCRLHISKTNDEVGRWYIPVREQKAKKGWSFLCPLLLVNGGYSVHPQSKSSKKVQAAWALNWLPISSTWQGKQKHEQTSWTEHL